MVAIPVIIIAINLNFSLAKLGFIILLARFIPVFKIIITTIQVICFYKPIENMLNLINKVDGQREIRKGKINFRKM